MFIHVQHHALLSPCAYCYHLHNLQALEAEKTRLEQRLAQQQQATQAAESARHEMELRAQQAAADQQRLTLALHATEGGLQQADGKLRQYDEDTRRLSSRLTQVRAAVNTALFSHNSRCLCMV